MKTQNRSSPTTSKIEHRNIRIRKSPEVARSLFWLEKTGKTVHQCTLNYDGGRGKIRTYRLGFEDGRCMALQPLEIWTERQLWLLIYRATYEDKKGEMALVPVELLQRVLGYKPKEFAEPI